MILYETKYENWEISQEDDNWLKIETGKCCGLPDYLRTYLCVLNM